MTLSSALGYMRGTRYEKGAMSEGGMDWANRASPVLEFPGAPSIPLTRNLSLPRADGWKVLSGLFDRSPAALTMDALAGMLFMAYGFTREVNYGNETFLYGRRLRPERCTPSKCT